MNKRKVVLRADGNSQIGLGHVYRLLALAEMLKKDYECVFAINNPDEFVLNEIKKSCSSYISFKDKIRYQMPDLVEAGDEIQFDLGEYLCGTEIVVTDGYLFGEKYQLSVKATGAKLVSIDDLAVNHFFGDAVINHAPGIDRSIYNIEPSTLLLTGLDYAMLRQAFFKPFAQKNNSERNAFISLGGSDYFHYTKKIVQFLLQDESFKTLYVLTSSSFGSKLLSDLDEMKSSSAKINLHHNLSADELVNVMDKCTHAFVAASTILIESYSRGLKCFTGYYVENQKFVYNGFITQHLALGLDSFIELKKETISEKIKNQDSIKYLTAPFSSSEILKVFFFLCKTNNQQNILTIS
ncbi:MAG: UDP-2,4-diacetamido-2,4,6-trideoxy-beta-L-altropyranose hydrolase [Chitinophagaceae bacterium]